MSKNITQEQVTEWAARFAKASKAKAAKIVGNAILAGKPMPKSVKGVTAEDLTKVIKSATRVLINGSGTVAVTATNKPAETSTFVEITDDQRKEFNALATAHADETIGYWPDVIDGNTRSFTRAINRALRSGDITPDQHAKAKPGYVKPGYARALRDEFKRLCLTLAAVEED